MRINKRLNSSLDRSEVLELAMDAAIELTGAERGFVLLRSGTEGSRRGSRKGRQRRPGDRVQVVVARNLDQEELDHSHLKFSRGIAEQVMEAGEALVTADAQTDGRFLAESSVHAMHLKSVVCVPVVGPGGVLGALYLDNRFQRGHFTDQDVPSLRAFADQVAIALTNAQLHDELRTRNRELEAERRRVEALLEGQAAEIDRLTEEAKRHRIAREHRFDYSAIIATSPAMDDVFAVLDRVIDTELPILILGDSGTGKELIARAVHVNSPRSQGPLVTINCGALPESLLESELFGYERGAFTGAERARDGLVVQARGGTLFLDELGEMPRPMQVKLLRVLQEREVQPLGSSQVIGVDFRLVCATNRQLRAEVERGTFREDLFYRISAVEIRLPPLRERTEDIPALANHILGRTAEQLGRPAAELTGTALRKLTRFDWPGNVRQLEHVITKAVALSEGDRIKARDIDLPKPLPTTAPNLSRAAFERAEIERIAATLAEHRWNVAKVARVLGIPRATLYRRLKQYGLLQRRRSPNTP
ncbi:MAG: sigma-54-dependent Fis family transcriptional regulator [Deltaproteobacteria bacterium]|nr:sigma-54-dependent Fis family transcriptional regulator [Deltaproteobacteria bacterium]